MFENSGQLISNDKFTFFCTGDALTSPTSWIAWTIPITARFLYILGGGGGAGGGGGGASGAGVAGAGGEGGGSATCTKLLIPTILLPRTIYLVPGRGGLGGAGQVEGGAAGANGSPGLRGYITLAPPTTINFVDNLFKTGQAAATGGQAASGSTAGTAAGAAETAGSIFHNPVGTGGLFLSNAGINGANGGASGAGTDVPLDNGGGQLLVSSGAGGGSVNAGTTTYAGGSILGSALAQSFFKTIPGGLAGGGAGKNGHDYLRALGANNLTAKWGCGGSGGGGNTLAGIGGRGGDGGIGSGGGGGGGTNGVGSQGGRGGDGGHGFFLLQAF